jgi:hypothetical protein
MIRIKTDKNKDEVTSVLLEFFEKIEEKPMGMKGFMVMDDLQDLQDPSYLPSGKEKKIWIHFIVQITIH